MEVVSGCVPPSSMGVPKLCKLKVYCLIFNRIKKGCLFNERTRCTNVHLFLPLPIIYIPPFPTPEISILFIPLSDISTPFIPIPNISQIVVK